MDVCFRWFTSLQDRDYFLNQTKDGVLIIGRRCYEEPGHPLPDRNTIVVSTTWKRCVMVVSVRESLINSLQIETPLSLSCFMQCGRCHGSSFI